ncbi:MAG: sugar phosphate isomerase/epimerase [Actinomycetota bacterium]|nr:sugar phosphate isomerase/epimerase [Actinomycetota bacterium]
MKGIRVANAPVSFGVFELSTGAANLPGADEVAKAVADSGYEGIDLGPPGFLGRGNDLRRSLDRRHLDLSGGWVELRLADRDGFRQDLEYLEGCLDLFEAGSADDGPWWPRPTLADAGSPERKANPGRGKDLPDIGLDDDGWKHLAQRVSEAADRCRCRGLEPTFHHHACTYVEAPHEIERLLELTNVGLCLDSGHLLLGGGNPVQAFSDWSERINHVHVKDARLNVLERVVREGLGMEAVWGQGAFCELGEGDAGVDEFLSAVKSSGYQGWLVVEQDRIPSADDSFAAVAGAQARNRERLCRYGL